MGMLRNKISVVGIIVLLAACSGPLIQVFQYGTPGPEVTLSFRSPFTGGVSSQGRFLLPEMAGGTLRVTLERLDQKKVIFSQDLTPQLGTGGFLEASAQVKVPINVEFRVTASFLHTGGLEISRAEGIFSVGKNQTALSSPFYLLPTDNFPGLLPLSAGGSLAENLIVEDGKSKVVALTVEDESSGKTRRIQWTGGGQTGDILVVVKDSQGRPVESAWLNENPSEGLVFTPKAGGTYYIIVHNQPPLVTAPPVSVDLGRPSVPVSLSYDGNGATGGTAPAPQPSVLTGQALGVPGPGDLVKVGFVFSGWNTRADGIGDAYHPGETFNVGRVDVVLYAQWRNADEVPGTLKVGFTLSQPVYKVINFESRSVTIPRTGSVDLGASDPVMAAIPSGWAWYVDGEKKENQSGPSYRFQGDIQGVGDHMVTVTITIDGVAYSGDLKITVTPAADEGVYSITYSSRGADGGSAPVDLKEYPEGDPVVLLTGNLTQGSYRFLGWKTELDGSGVVHYPGESIPMPSSDLTLYPVWEDMVAVPGGTFSRDGSTTNLSVVSSVLMGRFTVTNAQWYAVMGGGAPEVGTENLPKTGITWIQAAEYCNILSLKEGLEQAYSTPVTAESFAILTKNGYRLPTQMEYMWAAMGGLSDSRNGDLAGGINQYGYSKSFAGYNGSNSLSDYAWSGTNSPDSSQKVGTKLPNELFLHDLSGNVFQWSNDTAGPINGGVYVNHTPSGYNPKFWMGGSWETLNPDHFKPNVSYTVSPFNPSSGANFLAGFRVVRNAPSVAWVPRAGLVGEWKLDGSAQAATGQNGAVYGATAGLDRKGNTSGALEFTPGAGKQSNMILGYTPLGPGAPGNYTVSFWVKFKTLQNTFLFDQTNGTEHNANIRLDTGKINHEVHPNTPGGIDTSQTSLTAGSWYHLSIVWSNSKVSIYINGKLDMVSTGSRTYSGASTTHVTLGQNARIDGTIYDQNWDLDGFLDDLRIYNRALTAAEVLALSKE